MPTDKTSNPAGEPVELLPCPRPFCGGVACIVDEEGYHSIECTLCGLSKSVARDASPADKAALLAEWNAPRRPAAESLPFVLSVLASVSLNDARLHLLDAAALIEEQAAELARLKHATAQVPDDSDSILMGEPRPCTAAEVPVRDLRRMFRALGLHGSVEHGQIVAMAADRLEAQQQAEQVPVVLPLVPGLKNEITPRNPLIADGFRSGADWMRRQVEALGPLYTAPPAAPAQDVAGLVKRMARFVEVVRECERLASSYCGTLDGVEEHGGDDHEDPTCAIWHRLYYAMFDADAALAAYKGDGKQAQQSDAVDRAIDWLDSQALAKREEVDEALRAFSGDSTLDNATALVIAIRTALAGGAQ